MHTYTHTCTRVGTYTSHVTRRLLLLSGHRPHIGFSFLVQSLMCKHDDEWARLNPHISTETRARGMSLLTLGLLHATRMFAANRALMEVHGLLGELVTIKSTAPAKDLASFSQFASIKPNTERAVLRVVLHQKSRCVCDSFVAFVVHKNKL